MTEPQDVLAEIRMPDWHDKPSYVHGWNTAMAAVRAALRATPVADTAGIDAALSDADGRIRAAEPPTHSTAEFKAGWHHAASASLTAVARARRAAALRTPKPRGKSDRE